MAWQKACYMLIIQLLLVPALRKPELTERDVQRKNVMNASKVGVLHQPRRLFMKIHFTTELTFKKPFRSLWGIRVRVLSYPQAPLAILHTTSNCSCLMSTYYMSGTIWSAFHAFSVNPPNNTDKETEPKEFWWLVQKWCSYQRDQSLNSGSPATEPTFLMTNLHNLVKTRQR